MIEEKFSIGGKFFLMGKQHRLAASGGSLTFPLPAPRWRLAHWDDHLEPVRGKTQWPLSSPWSNGLRSQGSGISFQPHILESVFSTCHIKIMIVSTCKWKGSTLHLVQTHVYCHQSFLALEWWKWGHLQRNLIVLLPTLLFNSQNSPVRWVLSILQTKKHITFEN